MFCVFSTNLTLGIRIKDLHSIVHSRRPVVVPIDCPNPKPWPHCPAKLKVPETPLSRWRLGQPICSVHHRLNQVCCTAVNVASLWFRRDRIRDSTNHRKMDVDTEERMLWWSCCSKAKQADTVFRTVEWEDCQCLTRAVIWYGSNSQSMVSVLQVCIAMHSWYSVCAVHYIRYSLIVRDGLSLCLSVCLCVWFRRSSTAARTTAVIFCRPRSRPFRR